MIQLNWQQIDTVILDLDGTLIDLYFDHRFWKTIVPHAYAQHFNLSLSESIHLLTQRYHAIEHSKDWYCLDFWAQTLQLPLHQLYRQHAPTVHVRQDVAPLLTYLRQQQKHIILLTDSNRFCLDTKLKYCDFVPHFDQLLSSHQFDAPKVEQRLWQRLQQQYHFDPARTLFIDDTEKVLDTAKAFGIAYTLGVENPDSSLPLKQFQRHFSVKNYRTLIESS